MGYFLVWCIGGGMLCAIVAGAREQSIIGWLVLGILFGPLALIVLFALPRGRRTPPPVTAVPGISVLPQFETEPPRASLVRVSAPPEDETKKCPDCAETIKAAAKVCRFCGLRFEQSSA